MGSGKGSFFETQVGMEIGMGLEHDLHLRISDDGRLLATQVSTFG